MSPQPQRRIQTDRLIESWAPLYLPPPSDLDASVRSFQPFQSYAVTGRIRQIQNAINDETSLIAKLWWQYLWKFGYSYQHVFAFDLVANL